MQKRFFLKGEILFEEGGPPGVAYIIQAGTVSLTRKTHKGFEKSVATIEPGNIIGEMSLVTNAPHSLTATAHDDGHAMILTREDLDQRLRSTDKVMKMILHSLISRLKSTY